HVGEFAVLAARLRVQRDQVLGGACRVAAVDVRAREAVLPRWVVGEPALELAEQAQAALRIPAEHVRPTESRRVRVSGARALFVLARLQLLEQRGRLRDVAARAAT